MFSLDSKKKPPLPPSVPEGRRVNSDRRKSPTPIFSRYTFGGRRKGVRRKSDREKHIYVDRYGIQLFLLILAIILLGIADAFYTLYHVHVNYAIEINPIMNFLLGKSSNIFFHVKYLLTALCLIVLCLHKNIPIVRLLLIVIFFIYLAIIFNHIYLFFLVP